MLRIACGALFVWVMVILSLLVVTDRLSWALLPWAASAAIAWACAFALFVLAYRRIHQRPPPVEMWLTMALSPVSLMRAPSVVSFPAAADAHPIAGAAVLCDDPEFLRIARLLYFDEVECRPKIEELARDRGLLNRLSAGPATWEPGLSRFCPRCHATYRSAARNCSDCPEVQLQALDNPSAGPIVMRTEQEPARHGAHS